MTAQTLARIEMPRRDAFYAEYVYPRRPVIITNLFAGHPISQLSTAEAASAAFGKVPLELQTEYSTAAAQPSSAARETRTFEEYLDLVSKHPSTRVLCTEYLTPARVSAQYSLPSACVMPASEVARPEVLNMPRRWGDHDLLSNVFLANRGNYAHTHYDGDHRNVLLYQVFGRKRVILFDPSKGAELGVLDGFRPGFCNTYLETMTEDEKRAFIDRAGGYEATLEPGEAVFMPLLIWHYLEYIDTGMSINFRFGRNRYGRFLCVDNFHRDYYIQNVASKMVDEATVASRYEDALEEIKAEFIREFASRAEKVRAMRALFKRLCAQIAPEANPGSHCPPEREDEQIARIEAELDRKGTRYTDAAFVENALARSEERITPAQTRVISDRVRDLGYPAGVREKLLYNRFGKARLDALTKAEAALYINTLASPGAAW